jgi:hypothetical protein
MSSAVGTEETELVSSGVRLGISGGVQSRVIPLKTLLIETLSGRTFRKSLHWGYSPYTPTFGADAIGPFFGEAVIELTKRRSVLSLLPLVVSTLRSRDLRSPAVRRVGHSLQFVLVQGRKYNLRAGR